VVAVAQIGQVKLAVMAAVAVAQPVIWLQEVQQHSQPATAEGLEILAVLVEITPVLVVQATVVQAEAEAQVDLVVTDLLQHSVEMIQLTAQAVQELPVT
jgi:hypothetical protein